MSKNQFLPKLFGVRVLYITTSSIIISSNIKLEIKPIIEINVCGDFYKVNLSSTMTKIEVIDNYTMYYIFNNVVCRDDLEEKINLK